MKIHALCALACFTLITPSLVAQTNASDSADQLHQLTTQLQESPGDQALREKIIALALTLHPRPATPDATIMAEGAAEYAFKNAKVNSDFSDAAKQYEKALLLAPWLAADYFNCGVAHERAGENKDAIRNFSLYLLAAPNADDATAVKRRIGGLQYAAQKAANEANSPEAKMEKFIENLDGGVWRVAHDSGNNMGTLWADDDALGLCYLAVKGNKIGYNFYIVNADGTPGVYTHVRHYNYDPNIPPEWTATLIGKTFSGPINQALVTGSYEHFTISDNGQTITEEARYIYPSGSATATRTFERIK